MSAMSQTTMTPKKPPFPPTGGYLQAVRETSRNMRIRANIKITKESIQQLLRSATFTASFQRVSALHGLALPLKFDSHLEELNLISVLAILNFASGYRVPLHEQLQRGAWDTIRAFVFSLFITSTSEENLLSSRGMQSISVTKVAELMGVNLHVERPHESIPGVIIGELGGPLHELAKLITQVLNETGSILTDGNYPNLGSFVLEALKEGARHGNEGTNQTNSMEIALERLVKAFPAFQDMSVIDGQPIYCFKKALFLLHAVRIRFGSITPPPFPIPSTEQSPVFTDNVLPSLLVHLGVIDLSQGPGLSTLFPGAGSKEHLERLLGPAPASGPAATDASDRKMPPKEGPILKNEEAYKLRAAAIDACELIVDEARSLDASSMAAGDQESWVRKLTLPDLDMWLWSIAKDRADYRTLERFSQRDTVFF